MAETGAFRDRFGRRRRGPYVSPHAMARYREHHPDATLSEIVDDIEASAPAPAEAVNPLVGRFRTREGGAATSYRISSDRRGVFALVPARHGDGMFVVTYLRFGDEQRRFVEEHWPVAEGGGGA